MQEPIRVLIADDHPLLRMGVRSLLQGQNGFNIVGESFDGDQTIELVRRLKPDTVLLDLAMPGRSGLDVLRHLRGESASTRAILLTAGIEQQQLFDALRLGARGVVIKDSPQRDILEAMRAVTAGRYWIDPQVLAELAPLLDDSVGTNTASSSDRFALTACEMQAIAAAVEGSATSLEIKRSCVATRTHSAVRVLVADTTAIASEMIVHVLRQDRRFGRAAVLTRPDAIGQAIRELDPDVAIVGLSRTAPEGFSLIRYGLSRYPKVRTIALLDCSADDLIVDAFRSGARGVVCRDDGFEVLRNSVAAVHSGKVWTSNDQLSCILGFLSRRWSPQTVVDSKGNNLLSRRELDVVRCVADGMTNRDIASQLTLSEHTVKNYLFRIFDKLGVSSRTELILYALHHDGTSGAGFSPTERELGSEPGAVAPMLGAA